MKAVMIEKPESLAVCEVADPNTQELLGPYDCRCEMLYGTICAGTDQHILHEALPWPMPYPLILGHESVGRVVSCGEKVRHLKVGDVVARVGTGPDRDGKWDIGWGGFAEWGFARDHQAMQEDGVPEAEWTAYRIHKVIPPDIDPRIGPLFITLRETLSYTNRLGVTAGSRVLVVGSGGNGMAFLTHSRNLGADAVMIGNATRASMARLAGTTDYADYGDSDLLLRWQAKYRDGFDVLIDTVGKARSTDAYLPLLANGGMVGIYGLDEAADIALSPTRARGTFTVYQNSYDEPETHDTIVEQLRTGKIDPAVWLGEERRFYEIDDIAAAFDAVRRREAIKPLIRLHRA